MFSETDIISKAWLVKETVNLIVTPRKVSKIFLIGSYASGKANEESDLDYLVELEPVVTPGINLPRVSYPTPEQMDTTTDKFKRERIQVIYGTEEAQKSMKKPYREITGGVHGDTYSPDSSIS
jgi:predicted nucleotidyltransferase